MIKFYGLILTLLVFQSCNTITLSEKEVNNISNLKVEILIEDGLQKGAVNSINAYLSNGEKNILNKNIKILLNGKPLGFFVRTGNYYDEYPVYSVDDLVRNESYYFEIILPDSTKYPLAYIKPSKITSEFYFSEKTSLDKDFVLNWKNNNVIANVELWKGVHQKDSPNIHSGGRYAESTIHKIINTENGSYKVPKSFYEDSLTVADYLEIRINYIENGLTNPRLIKNSKILYTYVIEKTIDLED